jgi:phosphomevalonate kinase
MRALAPGKVVLSGAHAVLEGAPAIVSAVSRYVVADAARPASFVTPEVRAALGDSPAPWFDATALRDDGHKLGLGSSAAILVASLAALRLRAGSAEPAELCAAVLEPALTAHAAAQGGGSGVDVAASAHGGTLLARLRAARLEVERVKLPDLVHLELWACGQSASTPELLAAVRQLRQRSSDRHRALLGAQADAAEAAARALLENGAAGFVDALSEQHECLYRLGQAAHVPIVTPEVRELHREARRAGAVVLPAGAGGGDIALYAGPAAPPRLLMRRMGELGYLRLDDTTLSAPGVHGIPTPLDAE